MTKSQKTAEELIEESLREQQANLAQGVGVFDGGTAWPQLCKQMGEAALNGALEDDFDDK